MVPYNAAFSNEKTEPDKENQDGTTTKMKDSIYSDVVVEILFMVGK